MNDEIFATISPKSYQKVESLRLGKCTYNSVGCPQITDKTIDETVMNFIELSGLDIGNSSINPERLLLYSSVYSDWKAKTSPASAWKTAKQPPTKSC